MTAHVTVNSTAMQGSTKFATAQRKRITAHWSTNRMANPAGFLYSFPVRDRLSKERRSWNMSRIRGKNTTPEIRVRSLLHRLGYRFRVHVRIPITAKHAEHAKSGGHRKAQSAQKSSLSSPNEERSRKQSTLNSQPKTFWVRPDMVLPKHKTAIFVHGCFWHRHRGCKSCTTPTNRREWWLAKLNGNAARDKVHQAALRKLGWRSGVVWERETEHPKTLEKLERRLRRD